jgi:hypothetical protein
LGSHYAIGLNALNCDTGDELSSEQVEAASRDGVLKALSQSATNMRKKLGESLASVQKYDVPLEQVTTPSLEALRAYSIGFKTWLAKGETAAFPFFKRAVELDPKFAMAYARMGVMHGNLWELGLSIENIRKAYELRANSSERERLLASMNSTKQRDSLAMEATNQATLGLMEAYFGEAQQGRADAKEAVKRASNDPYPREVPR